MPPAAAPQPSTAPLPPSGSGGSTGGDSRPSPGAVAGASEGRGKGTAAVAASPAVMPAATAEPPASPAPQPPSSWRGRHPRVTHTIEAVEWLLFFLLVAPGTFPLLGCAACAVVEFWKRRLGAAATAAATATATTASSVASPESLGLGSELSSALRPASALGGAGGTAASPATTGGAWRERGRSVERRMTVGGGGEESEGLLVSARGHEAA
ncbi:hypothetical protein MMPV_009916 [Pyropia vietnamensis]